MADRHVLLIDTDKQFQETLRRALVPYGVSVAAVDDGSDGLGRVRELVPELLVIAVELPKKDGYGLFSRAKKGAAKSMPIALVTSSVTPDDFAKHKKLSTHADEYIDKRTTSIAEIVRRFGSLIHLGPAQVSEEDLDLAVEEAEEFSIDEDMALEEDATGDSTGASSGFPDEATRMQLPEDKGIVDEGIDAETDAAFAALGMGDEEIMPAEPPAVVDDEGSFELEDAGSTAVRPNIDAALLGGFGIADAVPVEVPEPEPIVDEGEPLTQLLPPEEAAALENPYGNDDGAVPEPIAAAPEPEPELLEAEPEPELEEPALAAAPVSANDLDLGLDAVAAVAQKDRDRRAVPGADTARIAELTAETERLRRELDQARAMAVGGPGTGAGVSRESEFKNLRQMISRKEKELDDLKEELESKDKLIQQGRDKLKEQDKKVREAEDRTLNTQEELVTANELAKTLGQDKEKGLEREKGLKARLEASQTEVRKNHDEIDGFKKKVSADAQAAAEAMAREKAEHQRSRDDAAARITALEAAHRQALAEAGDGRVAALASLQHELDEARAMAIAAVESDRAEKLASLAQVHEGAILAMREEHDGEIAALHTAREEALAKKDREQRTALSQAAAEREQALSAAEERRKADLADAEAHRLADLAAAVEQHRLEKATLEKHHADDALRVDNERRAALAEAEERRKEQLAEAEERRVGELAAAEEKRAGELAAVTTSFESEREEMKSAYDGIIASLNEELTGLQKAILGAREQIATLEGDLQSRNLVITARDGMIANLETELRAREAKIDGQKAEIEELEAANAQFQEQVLKAYQKIKNDEAIVQKAKKAMAIALTLLDDGKGAGEAKT